MNIEELKSYTIADLRDEASAQQVAALQSNPSPWLNELVLLKRKTETQMTSSKARRFQYYMSFTKNELTQDEYNTKVYEEKVWKTNASRFIQQIEFKIASVKGMVHGELSDN